MDLAEAARFTKYDFRSNFLSTLHDWTLFEKSDATRIKSLESRLENYRASPLRRIAVPKSAIFSRPGALPSVDDWIVYTRTAVNIARKIESSLIAPDQGVLFSFRWSEDEPVRTFRSKHLPYQEYRRKSVELSHRYPLVLETDIASYFEHVDLQKLKSTLARLGAEPADIEFLFARLLPHWTHESGRGIPQGPWASSYIANALLDSVDKAMLQYGYTFIRYVDDMRVFCNDRITAKRALLHLTEVVRELGLTLQTSKTRILPPDEARNKWRGFEDVLGELEAEVAEELSEFFVHYGAYYDSPEEQEQEQLSIVALQALERLFETITTTPAEDLDRTGFKFILNRLATAGSNLAVPYCLRSLAELPDVAPECANYLGRFSDDQDMQRAVANFVASTDCIYDWQATHLVAAFTGGQGVCAELVNFCFRVAGDRNRHFALRSACIDLISRHGAYHQVQELRRRFAEETVEEVRASIILASAKLETTERATFLQACRGISPAIDAAVQMASEGPAIG